MDNSTNLKYTGQVNIKVGKNRFKQFNEGKPKLFEIFAQVLHKGEVDKNLLPASIDLICNDTSILYQNITNLSKNIEVLNNNNAFKITASISDTDIHQTHEVKNNNTYTLVLKSNSTYIADGKQVYYPLASIEVEHSVISQIKGGRQALIEWYLYISN